MAIDSIPPWLQISPADFVKSAQAGAQEGISRSAMQERTRADDMQHVAEMARVQNEQQRLQQAGVLASMENKLARDKMAQDFQLEQTRMNVADTYRNLNLDIQQSRLKQQGETAAQRLLEEQKNREIREGGLDLAKQRLEFDKTKTGPEASKTKQTSAIDLKLAGVTEAMKRYESEKGFTPETAPPEYMKLLDQKNILTGQRKSLGGSTGENDPLGLFSVPVAQSPDLNVGPVPTQ